LLRCVMGHCSISWGIAPLSYRASLRCLMGHCSMSWGIAPSHGALLHCLTGITLLSHGALLHLMEHRSRCRMRHRSIVLRGIASLSDGASLHHLTGHHSVILGALLMGLCSFLQHPGTPGSPSPCWSGFPCVCRSFDSSLCSATHELLFPPRDLSALWAAALLPQL